MARLAQILCIACFGILLILPTLQNFFGIFPPQALRGVEKDAAIQEPTLQSWFDGSFQTDFEAWYGQVLGLRDYFVRTDNEINFLLFHQLSNQHTSSLVLGKEDTLYERDYIRNYLALDSQPIEKMESVVKKIKKLQDGLAALGIPFFLWISPSKATIYPEYIPDHMLVQKRRAAVTNYQKMIPLLEAHDVNYLDGQKFISDLKAKTEFRLFPKGGTHWNFFASYRMTLELMKYIEALTGKKMHQLHLEKIEWDRTPRRSDNDLAVLANLWDLSPFLEENPYPVVKRKKMEGAELPNLLLAGASFANAPFWYLMSNRLISDSSNRYVYYLVKSIKDIALSIPDRDIVILESTVLELPYLDRGFMPLLLKALNKKHPSDSD